MKVEVLAPAKVNLALHVTGQRGDGYHLLDTLVGFGPAFDRLTIQVSESLVLAVEGPEASGVPTDASNLILKAARVLNANRGGSFKLQKFLPVASGIGGGSSDAAAAIRGLLALWSSELPKEISSEVLLPYLDDILKLGADVPMCLFPRALRARGIGEQIDLVDGMPDLPVVLMNPRIPVSTPEVFRHLGVKENAPMPERLPAWPDKGAFCEWLACQRNDLQAPAIGLYPEIGKTLDILEGCEGVLLARMSGSGATCFAIFRDDECSRLAAEKLKRDHPRHWIAGGWLGDKIREAMPKIS